MIDPMGWFLAILGILVLSLPMVYLLARVVAWASARKRHTVFSHLREVDRRDRYRC